MNPPEDSQFSPSQFSSSQFFDPGEGPPETVNILIVDDEPRNLTVLENHDVEVLSATNGRHAIDIIKNTPDLAMVLMDIMTVSYTHLTLPTKA